jgi:hypothetical protein
MGKFECEVVAAGIRNTSTAMSAWRFLNPFWPSLHCAKDRNYTLGKLPAALLLSLHVICSDIQISSADSLQRLVCCFAELASKILNLSFPSKNV